MRIELRQRRRTGLADAAVPQLGAAAARHVRRLVGEQRRRRRIGDRQPPGEDTGHDAAGEGIDLPRLIGLARLSGLPGLRLPRLTADQPEQPFDQPRLVPVDHRHGEGQARQGVQPGRGVRGLPAADRQGLPHRPGARQHARGQEVRAAPHAMPVEPFPVRSGGAHPARHPDSQPRQEHAHDRPCRLDRHRLEVGTRVVAHQRHEPSHPGVELRRGAAGAQRSQQAPRQRHPQA